MQRERGFQRGRPGRPHVAGRGGRGRGKGEDRRGLLKAQGGVKKAKPASVKNQIRSIERLLRTVSCFTARLDERCRSDTFVTLKGLLMSF